MSNYYLEYPALYDGANQGSMAAQRHSLQTTTAEYVLLFCVSVASATRGITGLSPSMLSLLLVVLAGLFVFKVVKKLDQDWYRCRALAESVKTSTWRFSMRAHPFEDTSNIAIPKAHFRNLLRNILKANQHLAERLENSDSEQVTESMIEIRMLPLDERVGLYVKSRIDEQRTWYAKKSKINKTAQLVWIWITILLYIMAALSLNSDILGMPLAELAFDPLIVLMTSVIGWLHMKKHSELIASYNLTVQEIGIIRSNSDMVDTEKNFSDFVNEAELAFSREHTQWVARRDAS